MSTVVRFAPSPTGLLHVGNARTAIVNYLFARKTGGQFLLRIDDTDTERSKQEYEDAIIDVLRWLGIKHDLFARQSERSPAHQAAADKLKAAGLLYPCYETAMELDRRRQRQIASGKPPVYDRAALKLTAEEREALEASGRRAHWRFKLSQTKVKWTDLIRGEVEIDTAHLSDPVLIREDGRFLYTLPSVVDDVDFNITHIIRGEDHVTNTAVQIEIFEALAGKGKAPAFAHHPLLIGAGGEALSKRLGSLSLAMLRDDGLEPMALASYLAKTGTSDPIAAFASMDELVAGFAMEKIARAPAHFDPAELTNLNAKLLHLLPYTAVAPRLEAAGVGGEAFWEAVKANLTRIADVTTLWPLVVGPVTPVIEDAGFAAAAAAVLPPEPFDETSWGVFTKAVQAATGRKGKDLFHPLRLALTGLEHGPELKKLLPLMGRTRALARLNGETA
ncbi:glutamyl-tRNA synthetase [Rhizomicrobium palustre]|uniref:Glutamate--tRNA ligase n=1 Tax=Rhizomicrobium palustre TaxID=189966 RepID=A0A846MUV3_9PROT|nr:glutamate--tRNA ligase [Rhizomicrobium palustre]NIK87214.1 glutamyl-tRNA synthetase [Rhizomicrobium palustre]